MDKVFDSPRERTNDRACKYQHWDRCYLTNLVGTRPQVVIPAWSQSNPADARLKLKQPTSLFVAWLAAVRTQPNVVGEFATRRIRPVTAARTLRPVVALLPTPSGGGGPGGNATARSMGAEKEARASPYDTEGEREEAPGGAREQQRTRPRVITSPVGAELSPPTRGAHRAPIGRAPCRGNVPASRRGFSFVSAHLRTSLSLSLSRQSSVSFSVVPPNCISFLRRHNVLVIV